MAAVRSTPRLEPANSQALRPRARPRSARSAALFDRQVRPSSRNEAKLSPATEHVVDWLGDGRRAGDFDALLAEPDAQIVGERATAHLPNLVAFVALRPLISRSMARNVSIRFTTSRAVGDTGAAPGRRRALAAMSASSKKPRRGWGQRDRPAPDARDHKARCIRHRRRPAGCRAMPRDAHPDASAPVSLGRHHHRDKSYRRSVWLDVQRRR